MVIFSLAVGIPGLAAAATLTFNAETNLLLPNGKNLTITNDSLAESIIINADSTLTISLASDSNITFQAADGWRMKVSPEIAQDGCSGTASSISITSGSSQDVTLTISGDKCSAPGSGGGGGGGGGAAPVVVTPTNAAVAIDSGNIQTESTGITLTLSATNAATMLIANKADFSDAGSWQNYATSASWTLVSGLGVKTVYVKFRSTGGGESAAVSDTIELIAPAAKITKAITGTEGGLVSLTDNKAAITIPSGAFSGSGEITITPTASYTAPESAKGVVGNQVYDFSATVGGQAITTFDKLLTLTFTYSDENIKGINESTLAVNYWDEATKKWLSLGGTIDSAGNKITATTAHFTKFAVIGEKIAAGGDLVKLACAANAGVNDPCKAVYYLGQDGKRYVFPNEKTYKTWYSDFSTVKTISAADLAKYLIGGNATYRPGVKLVKINTDPKVYAVAGDGTLRWVTTADIAAALYGASWATTLVDDISDAFFVNYKTGSQITAVTEYSKDSIKNSSPDINTDKGL